MRWVIVLFLSAALFLPAVAPAETDAPPAFLEVGKCYIMLGLESTDQLGLFRPLQLGPGKWVKAEVFRRGSVISEPGVVMWLNTRLLPLVQEDPCKE
jgi:hypothetical protein